MSFWLTASLVRNARTEKPLGARPSSEGPEPRTKRGAGSGIRSHSIPGAIRTQSVRPEVGPCVPLSRGRPLASFGVLVRRSGPPKRNLLTLYSSTKFRLQLSPPNSTRIGRQTVGLYLASSGTFFLRNANSPGPADSVFSFGPGGGVALPVVGDWDATRTEIDKPHLTSFRSGHQPLPGCRVRERGPPH
jgi:hypothetical protein